eukprot:Nk52_evm12s2039 gene=Nk52_evmTU12s2039
MLSRASRATLSRRLAVVTGCTTTGGRRGVGAIARRQYPWTPSCSSYSTARGGTGPVAHSFGHRSLLGCVGMATATGLTVCWLALQRQEEVHAFSLRPSSSSSSSVGGGGNKEEEMKKLLKQADALFSQGQSEVMEMYNILCQLNEANPGQAEILWRLARASRLMSKDSRVGKDEQKAHAYAALDFANAAIEADPNNWAAHKWKAIAISLVGDYEGVKVKLTNAFKIKEEFIRALELKPDDATTRHLLGVWCFTFADMAWYERKVAAAIFGEPPAASYEEALGHFETAEKLDPGFYKKNAVMLAKCYAALKNKDEAVRWREIALGMKTTSLDDEEAHKEALDMKL